MASAKVIFFFSTGCLISHSLSFFSVFDFSLSNNTSTPHSFSMLFLSRHSFSNAKIPAFENATIVMWRYLLTKMDVWNSEKLNSFSLQSNCWLLLFFSPNFPSSLYLYNLVHALKQTWARGECGKNGGKSADWKRETF